MRPSSASFATVTARGWSAGVCVFDRRGAAIARILLATSVSGVEEGLVGRRPKADARTSVDAEPVAARLEVTAVRYLYLPLDVEFVEGQTVSLRGSGYVSAISVQMIDGQPMRRVRVRAVEYDLASMIED